MILDEVTTKRLEDKIFKKVEESLDLDEVKSKMHSRVEKGNLTLIDGIKLQL